MKLIAVEEHALTPEIDAQWKAIALEANDPTVALHHSDIGKRLFDLSEARLSLMDEAGVDMQVLSITSPGLHDLQDVADDKVVDLAKRTNDLLAEAVTRHPTRFQAFATLPVTVPDQAANELDRCVRDLGFKGTMLSGRVGDHHLDHPYMRPVFEMAVRRAVPILLHPRMPVKAVRDAYYSGLSPQLDVALSSFGLGWHFDAGLSFVRLLISGIFDHLSSLQLILGHWGEMVLFYAKRFANLGRFADLQHPVMHYLQNNLYVTGSGMFEADYMRQAADIVGVDRLLFSTDYPFQYRPGCEARNFLDHCGLEGKEKESFAHANWERLTGQGA